MKRAFRYLLPLLLLMMLTLSALAEKYEFADDLTGEYLYPAGSDESTATYIYRYRYPQLSGDDEIAAMFNTTKTFSNCVPSLRASANGRRANREGSRKRAAAYWPWPTTTT